MRRSLSEKACVTGDAYREKWERTRRPKAVSAEFCRRSWQFFLPLGGWWKKHPNNADYLGRQEISDNPWREFFKPLLSAQEELRYSLSVFSSSFWNIQKQKGKIFKSETFRKFSGVVKRAGPELLYKLRLCKHYYMSSFIAKFYAKRIKMRVGLMW